MQYFLSKHFQRKVRIFGAGVGTLNNQEKIMKKFNNKGLEHYDTKMIQKLIVYFQIEI